MKRYSIDAKKFDEFFYTRKAFQWFVILSLLAVFLSGDLSYDASGLTERGVILRRIILIVGYLLVVGAYLLLRRLKKVLHLFYMLDKNTIAWIEEGVFYIQKENEDFECSVSELNVEVFKYRGRRIVPFEGLGYVVFANPKGQSVVVSSLVFDLSNGVGELGIMFYKKAKHFKRTSMFWFRELPSNQ